MKISRLIVLLFALLPTVFGCVTVSVYDRAVTEHSKIDLFTLDKACDLNEEIILKVTGVAAGEEGAFDILVDKNTLLKRSAQQPIVIPRSIAKSQSKECSPSATHLQTYRPSDINSSITESVIQSNGTDGFIYQSNELSIKFKVAEETHRPDLYKILYMPFTLVADIIITPIQLYNIYQFTSVVDEDITVKVVDYESSLPISDADVEIYKSELFSGCSLKDIISTAANGKADIKYEARSLGPSLCQIHVDKEGYHSNGLNKIESYEGRNEVKNKNITIKLRKIVNPQQLLLIMSTIHEGDRLDLLSILPSEKKGIIHYTPTKILDSDIDFDFPVVVNESPEKNTIGRGSATIRFFGEGGIQELIREDDLLGQIDLRHYSLGNVILAPKEGYSKQMVLKTGGQYIARLRDGQHYMKFKSEIISKDLKGIPYAELIIRLQPLSNENLETVGPIGVR